MLLTGGDCESISHPRCKIKSIKSLSHTDVNSLAIAPLSFSNRCWLPSIVILFLRSPLAHISTTFTKPETMRTSTVAAIFSVITWATLSVALPLPAIQYAPLSCCICDAQVLSFIADLSVPMSAQYADNHARAHVCHALSRPTPSLTLTPSTLAPSTLAPALTPTSTLSPRALALKLTPRFTKWSPARPRPRMLISIFNPLLNPLHPRPTPQPLPFKVSPPQQSPTTRTCLCPSCQQRLQRLKLSGGEKSKEKKNG